MDFKSKLLWNKMSKLLKGGKNAQHIQITNHEQIVEFKLTADWFKNRIRLEQNMANLNDLKNKNKKCLCICPKTKKCSYWICLENKKCLDFTILSVKNKSAFRSKILRNTSDLGLNFTNTHHE